MGGWVSLALLVHFATPAVVGQYVFALAVTAPIFLLANLQLREVQTTDAGGRGFGYYLSARLWTSGVATVAGLAFAATQGGGSGVAIAFATIARALDAGTDIYYGRWLAGDRHRLAAVSLGFRGVTALVATVLALMWTRSILVIVALYVAQSALSLLHARWIDGRKTEVRTLTGAEWRGLAAFVPLGMAAACDSIAAAVLRYQVKAELGLELVGVFGAISMFMQIGGATIAAGVTQAGFPRLCGRFADQDFRGFRALLLRLVGAAIGLGLAGMALSFVAGRPVLALVLGPRYGSYAWLLDWMMGNALLWYVCGTLGSAVTATRNFRVQLPILAASFVAVAVSGGLLVPAYGLQGAALASTLGFVVRALANAAVLARTFSTDGKAAEAQHDHPAPAVLYLGAAVVDDFPKTAAFSPAANAFQNGLIRALQSETDLHVALYSPVPSWPQAPIMRRGTVERFAGLPARSLGFVNLGVFKALSLSPAVIGAIVRWAWSNRGRERSVMIYNLGSPPGLAAFLGARLTRSKFLPFLCDVMVPGETVPDTALRRANFAIERWLVQNADGRAVINPLIAEDFAPSLHHVVIQAGIDREEAVALQPRSPTGGGLSEASPLRLLYAGGLDELHGLDLVLDTLAAHPELDVVLSICGRGPSAEKARAAAKCDPRVEFLGLVDREMALELTQSSDVVLSLYQTHLQTVRYVFPSKTIEILASGTPLLTTLPAGMLDAFGDVCWSLRDETPEGLFAALVSLIETSPDDRLARAAEARRLILETRTWDVQVGKLLGYRRTMR